MSDLPSFWGQHTQANIDLVQVSSGGLITAVSGQPADWEERLTALGFTRRTSAWLRMGGMTQSEFQYLSTSITLVGLQPDTVIDYLDDHLADGPDVPYAVQNTILNLWQRQSTALLVALSAEHGINYTRQQAWSLVEAAITGAVTPETETLVGLALTKLSLSNSIDAGLEVYAQSVGWLPRNTDAPASVVAKVIMGAGDTVSWADQYGVVHDGRLAGRLRSSDTGVWVHETAPRWVSGYPVVAPKWIDRSSIQFKGYAPDWLESDLNGPTDQVMPAVVDSAALTDSILLSSEADNALDRLLEVADCFPFTGWEEHTRLDDVAEPIKDELRLLVHLLSYASEHYYSNLPLSFVVLKTFGESKALQIGVESDGLGSRIALIPSIEGAQVFKDRSLDLRKAASVLDHELRGKVDFLQEQARVIAPLTEDKMPALPESIFMSGHLEHVASKYGMLMTQDGILKVIAAANKNPDVLGDPMSYPTASVEPLSPIFNEMFELSSAHGMDRVVPRLDRIRMNVRYLSEVQNTFATEAETGAVTSPTFQSGKVESVRFYNVSFKHAARSAAIPKELTGVNIVAPKRVRQSFSPDQVWPVRYAHQSTENALAAYRVVIGAMQQLVSEADQIKLIKIEALASRWHYMDRFKDAVTAGARMPETELSQHLNAVLLSESKGEFGKYSQESQARMLKRTVSEIRKSQEGAQAVVLFFSKRMVNFHIIPFKPSSLAESRSAVIQAEIHNYKTHRRVGKPVAFDIVSVTDPELCEILSGSKLLGGLEQTKKTAKTDGGLHQDTGHVSGYAIKDLRAMTRNQLGLTVRQMSDEQQVKYISKDVFWPRKSMLELRDNGLTPQMALAFDAHWKGLPKKPISTLSNHVEVFLDVIIKMRDSIEPVLAKAGEPVPKLQPDERFKLFSEHYVAAVKKATDSIGGLNSIYPPYDRKIRGIRMDWANFRPASRQLDKHLDGRDWSDLVKAKVRTRSATKSRVARSAVLREGPDYRAGSDVEADDFLKTFMFSGVEFGNWTNQAERAKHLNFAYDSMMDFSKIMGWEPTTLSLGGKLGLCIGSRGRGGNRAAAAHFEPANMAMNLTRMNGDGFLAHEYFHAVANHYGRIATGAGKDLLDLIGYPLKNEGAVNKPASFGAGMREEVISGFHDLLTSIMRKPGHGEDPRDISNYTNRSDMLINAIKEDADKKPYWATPSEMFARGMEVWFHETMAEQGLRNDYLVGHGATGHVFPDSEHIKNIQYFASNWLDSLATEVKTVNHPYLGTQDMPVLCSLLKASCPVKREDLIELAESELRALFGEASPQVIMDGSIAMPGMYQAATNIMRLHQHHADSGTFYHEAWHACHHQLLTPSEKQGLNQLFNIDSEMSAVVVASMEQQGWPGYVIDSAKGDPEEMAAYAFQLWTDGHLRAGSTANASFGRTRLFVDGVTEISSLFEAQDAELLFQRFANGELAARAGQGLDHSNLESRTWDDQPRLMWIADLGEVQEDRRPTMRLG